MAVSGYYDLLEHVGHDIEVETYGKDESVWNVSITCMTCHMILLDYNHPQVTDDPFEGVEEGGG